WGGEGKQYEPEEARGDAPGALLVAAFEQLGEDGDESGRQGKIRHECPEQVGNLEGDGERVDLPGRAEVVRGDDLANEAEYAGEGSGEREDRRAPWEPAAGALVPAGEYREGTSGTILPPAQRGPFHANAEYQATEEACSDGCQAAAR